MVRHPPESFTDERLGTIAPAIREVAMDGRPVAESTVLRWLENSKTQSAADALEPSQLAGDAVTIDLAEN